MSKLLFFLVVLGSGAVACAAAPARDAKDAQDAKESCTSLARQAGARVHAVIAGHAECATDADCVVVPQGARCVDQCTTEMARSGQPALDAIEADVNEHECSDFAALGCRVESPPCAPPGEPHCRAGRCQ